MLNVSPKRASIFTTRRLADFRMFTKGMRELRCCSIQANDMREHYRFLSASRESTSLAHAIARVVLRTSTWQGRERQQQKKFAWSPSRPRNLHFRSHRNPIHVLSGWSGCSRGRPRVTSFEPRCTAGNRIASQIEEAAQ